MLATIFVPSEYSTPVLLVSFPVMVLAPSKRPATVLRFERVPHTRPLGIDSGNRFRTELAPDYGTSDDASGNEIGTERLGAVSTLDLMLAEW